MTQTHNAAVIEADAHVEQVIIDAGDHIAMPHQKTHAQATAQEEREHAGHADELLQWVAHLGDGRIEEVAHNALLLDEGSQKAVAKEGQLQQGIQIAQTTELKVTRPVATQPEGRQTEQIGEQEQRLLSAVGVAWTEQLPPNWPHGGEEFKLICTADVMHLL